MKDFDSTIYAIYQSALEPNNWPVALSKIGALFNAEGSIIIFYNRNSSSDIIYAPELKTPVDIYLSEEWWRNDLHAMRAIDRHLQGGDVFNDFDIASKDEMETHPIYVDFFHKVGFGWLMCATMLPDFYNLVSLSVPRAKEKGSFTADEMTTLHLLGRHVEQSLRISLRLANLQAAQIALLSALDAIATGIYALNARGALVLANARGREKMERCFCTIDGRIMPRRREERAGFSRILDAAHRTTRTDAPPRPCVITADDGRRLTLWALPITEASRWRIGMEDEARILVLAVPLERDRMVDPTVIRDVFGLSLGEARLAALIGGGMAVQEAARTLGVTEGTARVVLKRVFSKLGINRQAELVLQLSTFPEI